MPKVTPLPERFWSKVERGSSRDCWNWTAYIGQSGYGRFQLTRTRSGYAHRVAYELAVGPIPNGKHLDHLCRNRSCVNPAHLEPVTSAENTRRSPITHGRETHCPSGHAYAGDNLYTYTDKRGYVHRQCRTCNAHARRMWGERNAATPQAAHQ